jgi:hypothetical protein
VPSNKELGQGTISFLKKLEPKWKNA